MLKVSLGGSVFVDVPVEFYMCLYVDCEDRNLKKSLPNGRMVIGFCA